MNRKNCLDPQPRTECANGVFELLGIQRVGVVVHVYEDGRCARALYGCHRRDRGVGNGDHGVVRSNSKRLQY